MAYDFELALVAQDKFDDGQKNGREFYLLEDGVVQARSEHPAQLAQQLPDVISELGYDDCTAFRIINDSKGSVHYFAGGMNSGRTSCYRPLNKDEEVEFFEMLRRMNDEQE